MRRIVAQKAAKPILLASFLLLTAGVAETTAFRHLEFLEFDWLSTVAPADFDAQPIVIVGIDEPSFAELDLQWPWPRGLHADLVRSLDGAGAALIVFDVLFAEPTRESEDAALADAIADARGVVLAADLVLQETPNFTQLIRVEPERRFRDAGAITGIAAITLDSDQVVRRIPGDPEALWRVVVRAYRALTGNGVSGPSGDLVQYSQPGRGIRYVSYYQALRPGDFLPTGSFRDRIVFVGLDLKVSPEVSLAQREMFATSQTAFTGWPVPGVEIQATLAANGLAGLGIAQVSRTSVLLLMLLSTALAYLAMRHWSPLGSALKATACIAGLGAISMTSFTLAATWIPVSAAVAAVVLVYVVQGGEAFLHQRRRKRQIREAFGYYVSRDVVREVIDHPEKLVLGGDRRELTVMFTDLAGFTALSEEMDPERVADLLNTYLTSMAEIVMAQGGTVDKFIGDALMAFWGAPLDDPEQAEHAWRAGKQMLIRMRQMRLELPGAGYAPLSMRMGIHSGQAVVGNMGSRNRFDYTAVGDNVNLASRLEGANKRYRSEVLLSAATVEKLEDASEFRFVDRVRVAGKERPIDIYSFCADSELLRLSDAAARAYRSRDWPGALALWREALAYDPADGVASVFVERLSGFADAPPAPDWDGVVNLDK